MKKRITLMTLVFILAFSVSVSAFPNNNDGIVYPSKEFILDGDLDYSEGGSVYIQSKEDKIILEEKLAKIADWKATKGYVEGTYNAINVPVFEQE